MRRFDTSATRLWGISASGSAAHENDAQRLSAPVRGQEACHTVKRQMHAIAAFVDEDGRRRAGARIGNLLDHLYRKSADCQQPMGKLATEV